MVRSMLNTLPALSYVPWCCSGLLLLGVSSSCRERAPATGAQQAGTTTAQPTPTRLPAWQELRVNDTLVLECRHPYTTLVPDTGRRPIVMWSHMALRGQRGYYQVLSHPDTLALYCLYQCLDEALVAAPGDILQFSVLERGHVPPEKVRRDQPLPQEAIDGLDRWTWDVAYRQFARYLTADLKGLPRRYEQCFAGGVNGEAEEEYRLLPYWISREQAFLKRQHRLPPTRRLLAYSTFSRELATLNDPRYKRGYGPLLLQLLRTWRAYPMPAATARHLDGSIQELRRTLRRAP
ncbi:hypothetical protein DNI29_22150 [Hymenobacter sediminis]|uniref:hypothetical protein n=1 Tax=Hymenobacter sediminis TaxID=2218621 RepID=UPI000DA69F3C|nr:hypothetical protein [Hymenobacter sediminis]RPD44102.1 hypothetical protein DNI29_22150 [Hymenobacter sediminis]